MPKIVRWFESLIRTWDSWDGWHKARQIEDRASRWGLPDSEVHELGRLRERTAKLLAFGGFALMVSAVFGGVLLGTLLIASFLGPATSLAEFHIPSELYAALAEPSIEAVEGHASSGISPAEELNATLSEWLNGTVFRVIGGFMLIMGIASAVLMQRVMPLVTGIFAATIPTVLSTLTEVVIPPGGESATSTERSSLKLYAGNMRPDKVRMLLDRNDGLPGHLVLYVRAQADLIDGKEGTSEIKQAAELLRTTKTNLNAPALTQYLIEKGADGKVTTVAGKAYMERMQARQDGAERVASVTVVAAAGAFGLATLIGGIGGILRRRYNRITEVFREDIFSKT